MLGRSDSCFRRIGQHGHHVQTLGCTITPTVSAVERYMGLLVARDPRRRKR
jgi:hypothetical protein